MVITQMSQFAKKVTHQKQRIGIFPIIPFPNISESSEGEIFGLQLNYFVMICSVILILIFACIGICIGVSYCQRNSNRNNMNMSSTAEHQSIESNGSKHLNFYRPAVLSKLRILLLLTTIFTSF